MPQPARSHGHSHRSNDHTPQRVGRSEGPRPIARRSSCEDDPISIAQPIAQPRARALSLSRVQASPQRGGIRELRSQPVDLVAAEVCNQHRVAHRVHVRQVLRARHAHSLQRRAVERQHMDAPAEPHVFRDRRLPERVLCASVVEAAVFDEEQAAGGAIEGEGPAEAAVDAREGLVRRRASDRAHVLQVGGRGDAGGGQRVKVERGGVGDDELAVVEADAGGVVQGAAEDKEQAEGVGVEGEDASALLRALVVVRDEEDALGRRLVEREADGAHEQPVLRARERRAAAEREALNAAADALADPCGAVRRRVGEATWPAHVGAAARLALGRVAQERERRVEPRARAVVARQPQPIER
mmetsp:Transcript_5643/g.14716  ORF Transcript_5643/g.14716 Transcript_5643/m.14716 type:complete len:356 (+) Transcript_5643:369-1436(+)